MENSQILELLKTLEKDSEWVSEKYEQLREKYEGKVFAVKNRNVICYADTIEELLDKLEKKGENASFLLIEAIPPRNTSFIL